MVKERKAALMMVLFEEYVDMLLLYGYTIDYVIAKAQDLIFFQPKTGSYYADLHGQYYGVLTEEEVRDYIKEYSFLPWTIGYSWEDVSPYLGEQMSKKEWERAKRHDGFREVEEALERADTYDEAAQNLFPLEVIEEFPYLLGSGGSVVIEIKGKSYLVFGQDMSHVRVLPMAYK